LKTYLDCVPCFFRQALSASRRATEDVSLQEDILRQAMRYVSQSDFSRPPPFTAREIYRLVGKMSGNHDCFKEIKHRSNKLALGLYPELKRMVEESSDPVAYATKLAIAGNIIDFGANSDLDRNDIQRSIDEAMHVSLPEAAMERFRQAVSQAQYILYIGDNAGEIVFDKLLIEQLLPQNIIYAVRGSPVINDVTLIDTEEAGLNSLVEVIDSGSDVPGIVLDQCSKTFIERYEQADLVIAKGQGNYETLNEEKKRIFFMMKVKCPVVANDIGCRVGSMVIKENQTG
jgi:uncharacterized protein with ATP-grasp and redox domains